MVQPVKVGIWPLAGLDGSGLPRPGPLIGVRWRHLTYAEYQRFRDRIPAARTQYLTDPERPCGATARPRPAVPFAVLADVYETVMLVGPPLAEAPAGVVAWIAEQELRDNPYSGTYSDIRRNLDRARASAQGSWLSCARAIVASTFRYSFEEIDTWPPELFYERVAQAELLTGVPLEPADPNASKPQPGQKQSRNNRMRPSELDPRRMQRGGPEQVVEDQQSFQSNRRR